jgi:hypothetical protein
MTSVEELRAEARRLRDAASRISNPETRKELASPALELSQRAEALENGMIHADILRANIERYRSLLAGADRDENQKRIVQEMLADAEALLANPRKDPP